MDNSNINNATAGAGKRTLEQELSDLRNLVAALNDENSQILKEKKKGEDQIWSLRDDINELTRERDTAKSDYEELVKIAEKDKKQLVRERRKLTIAVTIIAIEFVLILISMFI